MTKITFFCSATGSWPSIDSIPDEHTAHFWFKHFESKFGGRNWDPAKLQKSMKNEKGLKQSKIFGMDRMIENRTLCENIDSGNNILVCVGVDHFEACDPRKDELLKEKLNSWQSPFIWAVAEVSIYIHLVYIVIKFIYSGIGQKYTSWAYPIRWRLEKQIFGCCNKFLEKF